jgi:hypothetical protein
LLAVLVERNVLPGGLTENAAWRSAKRRERSDPRARECAQPGDLGASGPEVDVPPVFLQEEVDLITI